MASGGSTRLRPRTSATTRCPAWWRWSQDTPEALKGSIQADTVIDLRIDGDTEVARDAIARLPAVRSVEVRDQRLHILARDQDGVAAAVISTTSAEGINVRDLSINPPSLEAVFIQLTGRELRE